MTTEERIRGFYTAFNRRAIDGRVEPLEITAREDGRWTVLVHQVVRSPDGALLADEHVQS